MSETLLWEAKVSSLAKLRSIGVNKLKSFWLAARYIADVVVL